MKGRPCKIAPWTPLPLIKKKRKKVWFKATLNGVYHKILDYKGINFDYSVCGLISNVYEHTGRYAPPLNQRCARCMKVKPKRYWDNLNV